MGNTFYTLQFRLRCLSTFLFFSSFNMIIPELPAYLESLGGGEYKGFIIGLLPLQPGSGWIYANKTDNLSTAFGVGAVLAAVAWLYLHRLQHIHQIQAVQ